MRLEKLRSSNQINRRFRGLLYQNPVLYGGLALPFAISAAFSLQNGVALSILMAMTTLPVLLVASLLQRRIPRPYRIILYAFIAMGMLFPARMVIAPIAQNIFDSLGLYFTIMAVNTLMFFRAEEYAVSHKFYLALFDGLNHVLGFSLVVCILGAVRELFGSGTLWGEPVDFVTVRAQGLLVPFSGFILLAFLAALSRVLVRSFKIAVLRMDGLRLQDLEELAEQEEQEAEEELAALRSLEQQNRPARPARPPRSQRERRPPQEPAEEAPDADYLRQLAGLSQQEGDAEDAPQETPPKRKRAKRQKSGAPAPDATPGADAPAAVPADAAQGKRPAQPEPARAEAARRKPRARAAKPEAAVEMKPVEQPPAVTEAPAEAAPHAAARSGSRPRPRKGEARPRPPRTREGATHHEGAPPVRPQITIIDETRKDKEEKQP